MISISMMLSLTGGQLGWTTKTSAPPHVLQNLVGDLAVAEAPQGLFAGGNTQVLADLFCEFQIRASGKDFQHVKTSIPPSCSAAQYRCLARVRVSKTCPTSASDTLFASTPVWLCEGTPRTVEPLPQSETPSHPALSSTRRVFCEARKALQKRSVKVVLNKHMNPPTLLGIVAETLDFSIRPGLCQPPRGGVERGTFQHLIRVHRRHAETRIAEDKLFPWRIRQRSYSIAPALSPGRAPGQEERDIRAEFPSQF